MITRLCAESIVYSLRRVVSSSQKPLFRHMMRFTVWKQWSQTTMLIC